MNNNCFRGFQDNFLVFGPLKYVTLCWNNFTGLLFCQGHYFKLPTPGGGEGEEEGGGGGGRWMRRKVEEERGKGEGM